MTGPAWPLRRLRDVAAYALLVAMVAGCLSTTVPSATPAGPIGAPSEAAGGSGSPDVSPSSSVSLAPSAATVVPTSTPVTPCAIATQRVRPPTDRLLDIIVKGNTSADLVRFVFGEASLEGSGGTPTATLQRAKRPYTQAGSGKPIAVLGQRVAQLRFDHMSNTNDIGEPTYQGPPEVQPKLPTLRDAVLFDDSEGVVAWYIGFDGPGCATLSLRGNEVIVTIEHG